MLKKVVCCFLTALLIGTTALPVLTCAAESKTPTLTYQTHLSHIGWQNSVNAGAAAGAPEQGEVIEALKLYLDTDEDLSVTYSAHVQNIGWQKPVEIGETAGTTGQAYQMEAVRIELTGADAAKYDIYYRANVAGVGTLGWAKNGETAGSENMSAAMRSIEILLLPKGSANTPATDRVAALNGFSLSAQAHVAQLGWLAPVDQTAVIGTVGGGLGMESLSLTISGVPTVGISYRVLMKGRGWSEKAENGANAGTTGQAIPLQAVEISLSGKDAASFDIYYQTHISNFGWLDWAKNGESAGAIGLSNQLEAIRIALVAKGSPAPGKTALPRCESATVNYRSYVQQRGWQSAVKNGSTSGTIGQTLALRAFSAEIESNMNLGIEYAVHQSNLGWRGYVANGATAGTESEGEQIEAIRIRLTGAAANYYDVWYRVHSHSFGWLDWTCNGENAGTQGYGYSAQAIEVTVLPKGSPAPGRAVHPFYVYSSKAGQYADRILNQIGRDLYAAFRWASGNIRYVSLSTPPAGVSHAEWYGEYGFENRKGNCYVMASVFYWMAKRLGYDVYLVEGSVPLRVGGMGPHSWCEIVINGTTYVFDPDFTYETGKNGYQITYGTSGTWRYSNYRRVD